MIRTLMIVMAAGLLLLLVGGSMSRAQEQFICSPMSGVVLRGGAPEAGITIRRDWSYNDTQGSDTVQTGSDGRFAFEAVPAPRKRWFSGLSTPVVVQRYYALEGGSETEILYINSRSLDAQHETGGAAFDVTCDLSGTAGNTDLGWGLCSLKR